MQWLIENYQTLLTIVGLLISATSLITGLTPTPKDDAILAKIIKALSIVTSKDEPGTFKRPLK